MWPLKKRVTASAGLQALPSDTALETGGAPRAPAHYYVEFESNGEKALQRLTGFFGFVKTAKDSDAPINESQLSAYLTDTERAYFSNLTAEEMEEWNEYWFSTPLPKRHSAEMPMPEWDFESMLAALWNGDYDLIAIRPQSTWHALEFNPHGYPYGGTGCLVAMVQCFGHRVVGIEDGTGYKKYLPPANVWKPRPKLRD